MASRCLGSGSRGSSSSRIRLYPSAGLQAASAHVERHRDPGAVHPDGFFDDLRSFDGDGPEHHPSGSLLTEFRIGPRRPDASRYLDLKGTLPEQPPHGLAVPPVAEGGVEIHDVEPTGARGGEVRRYLKGIVAVHGLAVANPAQETDDTPSREIYRRDRFDAGFGHSRPVRGSPSARKFESTAAPRRPLFSGWNWIPNTRPSPAAEAKRTPYSVAARWCREAEGSA